MAQPKPGDVYTFLGLPAEDGSDQRRPLGIDAGALMPGTNVTIREVVEADETGAHDSTEDAAVIEWEAQALVSTDEGVKVGPVPRAMAIGLTDGGAGTLQGVAFADIFEKAK